MKSDEKVAPTASDGKDATRKRRDQYALARAIEARGALEELVMATDYGRLADFTSSAQSAVDDYIVEMTAIIREGKCI